MSESSTTVFDADAFATEPPEMKIGGRVYVGRILSIVEWSRFQVRLSAFDPESPDPAALHGLERTFADYLRAVFPPVVERRWLVFPRTIDPIAQLEQLGPMVLVRAFTSFFGHQRHAMGLTLNAPKAPMTASPSPAPGNTSSGSTTPAPGDSASANGSS